MNGVGRRIAIDAHVHIHHANEADSLLHAAAVNVAAACPGASQAVLMLAERQDYTMFDLLRSKLAATGDEEALWADPQGKLLIVAGSQVVTAEGLEILGLGTAFRMADGAPAEQVIAHLQAADAIVVLPWGAGKWLGRRGRLVDSLTQGCSERDLFLGDNASRPALWRVVRLKRSRALLSGSDPLPIPGGMKTVGRFGSMIEGCLPPDRPAAALKRLLRDPAVSITPFGAPASAIRFVHDQARLRLRRTGIG